MACYRPIRAYRSKDGVDPVTGKWPLTFNINEAYKDLQVTLPCGQCIGCRLAQSRDWAARIVLESRMHEQNSFLTLTYSDDKLPENRSLRPEDMTKFLKRLRRYLGDTPIRYYQCGEYGEATVRPHHHMILFGEAFYADRKRYKKTYDGHTLYNSDTLQALWPYGHAVIADVSFESAAYVARYCTKKITGERAPEHYGDRIPEYATMSRRPGIGYNWFTKYHNDLFPDGKIHIGDREIGIPRYFEKLTEKYINNGKKILDKIKNKHKEYYMQHPEEFTPSRLAIKEELKIRRFTKYMRDMEVDMVS